MRFNPSRFGTLRFIFIAVVFMLLADTYLFGGKSSYIDAAKQTYYAEQVQKEIDQQKDAPVRVEPENGAAYFEMEEPEIATVPDTVVPEPEVVVPAPEKKKVEALAPVIEPAPFKGKARIAIIIDDLGMDIKRSRRVVEELPAPITLAFLPYGTKTRELAALGKQKGHHLIIHVPMDAMDKRMNIGPMGLHSGMTDAVFEQSFNTILQSFDGYEGINNHMGSRLTQDDAAMTHLMALLKAHDLFFVDSKTIGTSIAAGKAREEGVPYADRDVFLDHVDTREFVDGALLKAERLALRRGSAIAIGHPKDFTIAGLKAWIPTLAAKGIELVPVKDLLVRPAPPVAAATVEAVPAVSP